MVQWLATHGIESLLLYFVFNAFVSGMPEPMPNGSIRYLWLYRSLHAFAGNIATLVKTKGINGPEVK